MQRVAHHSFDGAIVAANGWQGDGMRISSPIFLALAALVLPAGCATPPGAIEAKPATAGRFADLDCPMLITERDRRIQIRDLLSDAQNERFRADLISGALTGLTQSMMNSPREREEKIAEVKGEIIALNQQILAKGCMIRLPPQPATATP